MTRSRPRAFLQERPRPEFAAMATMMEPNPVTGVKEPYFSKRTQLSRMLTGSMLIIIMVSYIECKSNLPKLDSWWPIGNLMGRLKGDEPQYSNQDPYRSKSFPPRELGCSRGPVGFNFYSAKYTADSRCGTPVSATPSRSVNMLLLLCVHLPSCVW